jgi:hypothetical protein
LQFFANFPQLFFGQNTAGERVFHPKKNEKNEKSEENEGLIYGLSLLDLICITIYFALQNFRMQIFL